MQVFEAVKQLEAAGAIGAEIEVVPVEVAKAISERTSLIMLSMGAGTGCDAQYLFAEDILGQNRGHMPRHSKVYRNFAAEYDRLQAERIAAFSEYVADVNSGAYPEDRHVVRMDPAELSLVHEEGRRKELKKTRLACCRRTPPRPAGERGIEHLGVDPERPIFLQRRHMRAHGRVDRAGASARALLPHADRRPAPLPSVRR